MTYRLRVTGRIGIYPPLRWSEIQTMPELLWDYDGTHPDRSRLLRLDIDTDEQHTDDGVLQVRTAPALRGDLDGDPWDEDVSGLVAAFVKAIDGLDVRRTLTGTIYTEGEDHGDVRRYRPERAPAGSWVTVHDHAVILWPDGRRATVEHLTRPYGDTGDVLAPPLRPDARPAPQRADDIVRWLRDHEGRAVAGLVHQRLADGAADGGPESPAGTR